MADENTSSISSSGAALTGPAELPSRTIDGTGAMAAALVDKGVLTQEQAAAALANPEADVAEGGTLAPQVAAMQDAASVQGVLTAAGVDQPTAKFFGEMVRKATLSPPSEEAKAEARADCEQHLRWLWGANFDGMLAAARHELADLARSNPKLPDILDGTGLGNHPLIVRQLAERAVQRAAARRLGLG
jgi:hypothetical protein